MGEEIAFENGRISDFQGLVTLTLDRVILHTVMHYSSTSTYTPKFIEIEELFVDGWTDGHLRSALLGRPKNTLTASVSAKSLTSSAVFG